MPRNQSGFKKSATEFASNRHVSYSHSLRHSPHKYAPKHTYIPQHYHLDFSFCSSFSFPFSKGFRKMPGSNLETRSLLDELKSIEKKFFFDLGHPLLNRIAETFVTAAGIGAAQAVSREAYFSAVESVNGDVTSGLPPELTVPKKAQRLSGVRGENNRKSVEALVKSTGKESLQWGLAAGVYSGLTYGLKEARGVHDWKNSALAGAITGGALALTLDNHSHEQVVQCVITGAAISAAANLLTGIF